MDESLAFMLARTELDRSTPSCTPRVREQSRKRLSPRTLRLGARSQFGQPQSFTSDEVYFLPGAIEISTLRSYQALERLTETRILRILRKIRKIK